MVGVVPKNRLPDRTGPETGRPQNIVPDNTAPSNSVPANTVPEGTGSDKTVPECSVQDGLRHLVHLLPRVGRGLRRRRGEPREIDGVTLGPRHGSALALLREDDMTVGGLAAVLDLNLATVSGLVADLERVAFVQRGADPADRRRTIVTVRPDMAAAVDAWLEKATAPIAGVLKQLTARERAVFVKAVGYLDAELNASAREGSPAAGGPQAPLVATQPTVTLASTGTEAAPTTPPGETP